MGTFNIDFNQFKPSSRGGQALPSLSPTSTPAPTIPKPLPQPIQTTTQPQPQDTSSKGKIFTGSLWQKLLDVPMLPGYALAGFTKGGVSELKKQEQAGMNTSSIKAQLARKPAQIKGIWEGIKNRASFGTQPEDANLMGEISRQTGKEFSPLVTGGGNLLASLMSPSLSITKAGSVLNKIPGVSKVLSAGEKVLGGVSKVAKETPFVYKAIEKFSPYFRRPEVGKIVSTAEDVAGSRVNKMFEDIKKLATGLSSEDQVIVGQLIEGKIKTADPRLVAIAKQAQQMGTQVGKELVQEGLLPKDIKLGQYLPHIFDTAKQTYINEKKSGLPKLVTSFFKKRTGKEGYLQEFAPSLFKGLGTEVKDIEVNKLFKELATKYGEKVTKKVNVPEGYVWAKDVVKNPQLQKLFKRTAIPSDVADYIARVYDVPKQGLMDKALNVWKAAKTIYNPAYHARNLVSNQMLSSMGTGRSVLNTAVESIKSLRSLKGKGAQEMVDAARSAGLIDRKTITKGFEELKDMGNLSAKPGLFRTIGNKVKGLQQGSEEVSKLTVFKAFIEDKAKELGTTVENVIKDKNIVKQAANKAEEAIFSPYRISQGERNLVSKVIPFYSFARQAIPFTLKTLANNPERILKYTKTMNAVEDVAGKDKVPVDQRTDAYKQQIQVSKNKNGKVSFFDPTYVAPWGGIGQESGQLPFGLSVNPFVTEAYQQMANKNIYFKKPITESPDPVTQRNERVSSVLKMLEPTFLTNLRTKVVPAVAGKPDQYGRERTTTQSLLDTLFGFKTSKVSPSKMKQDVNMSKVYDLRSYKKEEESVMNNKSLSPEEKNRRIKRLKILYQTR